METKWKQNGKKWKGKGTHHSSSVSLHPVSGPQTIHPLVPFVRKQNKMLCCKRDWLNPQYQIRLTSVDLLTIPFIPPKFVGTYQQGRAFVGKQNKMFYKGLAESQVSDQIDICWLTYHTYVLHTTKIVPNPSGIYIPDILTPHWRNFGRSLNMKEEAS